jgi:hypothetical protein
MNLHTAEKIAITIMQLHSNISNKAEVFPLCCGIAIGDMKKGGCAHLW